VPIRDDGEAHFNTESFVDATGRSIFIDPEFEKLMPPLTPHEYTQLECNLRDDGVCIEPIALWSGRNIVLDGHYRLRLCERNGIPYRVVELHFTDREEAQSWIIRRGLGRRSLTEGQRAALATKAQVQPPGGLQREFDALVALWKRTSVTVREKFLAWASLDSR